MQRLIVISVVLIGLSAGTARFLIPTAKPPPSAPASQPEKRPGQVNIGDRVIIGDLDEDDLERSLCMARQLRDVDAVTTIVRDRDNEKLFQLIRYQRAMLVGNRTPATLLERGEQVCRVRILTGEHRGREGWISPEFLLREAPR